MLWISIFRANCIHLQLTVKCLRQFYVIGRYSGMADSQTRSIERLTVELDWRSLFDQRTLKQIEDNHLDLCIHNFQVADSSTLSCVFEDGKKQYNIRLSRFPRYIGDNFSKVWGYCSCPRCAGIRCIHIGAMLLYREKHEGPFVLTESDRAYAQRISAIKRDEELSRRKTLQSTLGNQMLPVADAIGSEQEISGIQLYDFASIMAPLKTTVYAVTRMSEIAEDETNRPNIHISEDMSRDGLRELTARLNYSDDLGYYGTRMTFHSHALVYSQCNCEKEHDALCEHMLLLMRAARKYTALHSPSDLTDEAAAVFFRSIQENSPSHPKEIPPQRQKTLSISPRISMEDGVAKLTFKIGRSGSKMIICRNPSALIQAYNHKEQSFELSKKESVDFTKEDFTDESMPLFALMIHRFSDIQAVNSKLLSRSYYTPALNYTYQQQLSGSLLDQFYDVADGMQCEYQDKSNGISTTIQIGHCNMSFPVHVDRLSDARGAFVGVVVSGVAPVEIHGSTDTYILNQDCLSRVTSKEEEALAPFRSIADPSGLFRFHVGLNHLQELYYRVLPGLIESSCVQLIDHCSDEAEAYLPPEPVFAFYCDLADNVLSIKTTVTYADRQFLLAPDVDDSADYHDRDQEARVIHALTTYVDQYDPDRHRYFAELSEEDFFHFLRDGIPYLSHFGVVSGTDVFRAHRVQGVPQITVGVSVQSGLMDLSISSTGMTSDELLALLDSYQKKKKYYRLRSGDYIDLEDSSEIDDITDFFHSLDLLPTEAIKEKMHLPLYRALYIDRMLEEHENIISSRDRTYRTLVKNFRTVKDADDDIPDSMKDVLRPYQSYGFKWLSTLGNAGFGGILADEMGLGKTIQVIAFLLSAKESGIRKPSLIICPSSLVFNWLEEFKRFAPQLNVQTISGTQHVRNEQLKLLANSLSNVNFSDTPIQDVKRSEKYAAQQLQPAADVFLTSYDLLKRDISQYEPLGFYACILDEAQYIKNQTAAVSKAVKIIHADHRFALTGTPIENRLSELWSIFDFLMPGFLYSSSEFIERFETPIAKSKDADAISRLKKMVSPFILRRLKSDVLKDLPPKLEEVRYARFGKDQQMLYDAQVVHMRSIIQGSRGTGEDKLRILAELTHIRQICCDPSLLFDNYTGSCAKREACLDLIEGAMDAGHRMLIFSQFTSMLSLLEKDLQAKKIPYYIITGATPKEQRLTLVQQFNEGTTPVFLISLKAGGTGLNLTGADVVIHYDPWWNLSAQNQATDRAHRIGQTRQVTVIRLIVKDTIEEKILELQDAKKDLADAILEGRSENLMSMSKEELLSLLS